MFTRVFFQPTPSAGGERRPAAFVPLRAPGSEGPGRGREAAAAEEDWHLGRGPDACAMKRAGPVVTKIGIDRMEELQFH